uniref:Uncharacterized protein n=1 Tax=Proboscia inermis TaxID=420281 RepID=A0A7S0CFU0_9STRA
MGAKRPGSILERGGTEKSICGPVFLTKNANRTTTAIPKPKNTKLEGEWVIDSSATVTLVHSRREDVRQRCVEEELMGLRTAEIRTRSNRRVLVDRRNGRMGSVCPEPVLLLTDSRLLCPLRTAHRTEPLHEWFDFWVRFGKRYTPMLLLKFPVRF